jgi:hypothetical protein
MVNQEELALLVIQDCLDQLDCLVWRGDQVDLVCKERMEPQDCQG